MSVSSMFKEAFSRAVGYAKFLERFGSPDDRRRWAEVYERFRPTETQKQPLDAFVREMNVLCLAGAWCGDCAVQCPILQRLAESSAKIQLRFLDRDSEPALSEHLQICGGRRVPVVVFLSEDFEECGRYGDRTLSRYRKLAGHLLFATRPRATAPPEPQGSSGGHLDPNDGELSAMSEDWLRELERIQLMLRLSPRLRSRHGD